MGREDQIINARLSKISEMREKGIEPYPHNYEVTSNSKEISEKYSTLKEGEITKEEVSMAGRVMGKRGFGKINFLKMQDFNGTIQVVLQEGETPKEALEFLKNYVDSGDYVGIKGKVMKTQRGEVSVLVEKITMLTKSTRPLPDKFYGLQDKEERYRKRYLDLIMNPEVKEIFLKREKILSSIRETMNKRGFNEVDTPYLQAVYGGAEARPFETHLNALDMKVYLAISPELYLKRLIVGGFDKVFTIARNFRNEGVDRTHNPEFTMMEVYQAYADYNDMMKLTEEIFENACIAVNGSTKVKVGEVEVDFKSPWKKVTMADSIKEHAKIDVNNLDEKELLKIVKKENIETKGESWGYLVMALFEHYCEKNLIQPTFVIDHPRESTPLCKGHRNDPTGRLIERFEPFCLGMELANAYSELNDPVLQKSLLEGQEDRLNDGDEEAHPYDRDFVNAIEIGLPPTGGLGIGIDRMVILLTGQESIRDVILFPFMKPLTEEKEDTKKKK